MKKYHEVAVVKDGNMRVGYFVESTQGQVASNQLKKWVYISDMQFETFVKSGEMQYFEWRNGRPQVVYSQEDITKMKNMGLSVDFIEKSKSNYFDMDCCFKRRHIQAAQQNQNVAACCLGEYAKVMFTDFVLMYAYGSVNALAQLCSRINPTLLASNGEFVRILMPVKGFKKIIDDSKCMPLINTSTARWLLQNSTGVNKHLVRQSKNDGRKDELIALCDSITSKNERTLGI